MSNKPGFGLILDVSNGLLPQGELDALPYAPGIVIPREYGAFVHVPTDTLEDDVKDDKYENFPELLRVLRWAVKRGAFWVLFDADGVIDDLDGDERLLVEDTELVTFHWSRLHGDCENCGLPAAFYVPDAYGKGKPLTDTHKRCAVCAANDAVDGERVIRIDPQD